MPKDYVANYRRLRELSSQLIAEMPDTMAGFGQLHAAAVAGEVLETKTKELIALGIGIAARCDGCIAFHIHDALDAGASRQEIIECIGIAILMGGSPSMVYGCDALAALDQFEKELDLPL